jgi:glycosyltransferase involved in cell wall biosynthesis
MNLVSTVTARHRSDVAFAMTGDVHRNTRALRQLDALCGAGLTVTLLAFPPTTLRTTLPHGVDPVYVPDPGGRGPRRFHSIHRAMTRALRSVDAAVFHASDLYVLRAVRSAAVGSRAPFTYDARELYAHVAATAGRPLVSRYWRAFEAAPARQAAVVWTVSDAIADHLARAYGITRPTVLLNAPVAGPVRPDPYLRGATGLEADTPLFVHLGQVRRGRGGEALVRAFARVPGVALAFVGYGPEMPALERLASGLGAAGRIFFLDPVPPGRIRAVVAAADVGVTLLEDSCLNHRYALPNKLFDYLAAGLPVLASRLPELGRIVEGHDVGLTVDPGDSGALVEAVRRMGSDAAQRVRWARNALAAAETFDWAKASDRFTSPFRSLVTAASVGHRSVP